MSEVVITPKGYIYIDDTDWSKVMRHKCGASNNTAIVQKCLKCGEQL